MKFYVIIYTSVDIISGAKVRIFDTDLRQWELKLILSNTLEDKDGLITFWRQKVKDKGQSETTYGHITTLGILKVIRSNVRVWLIDWVRLNVPPNTL